MLTSREEEPVESSELLARFVLNRIHVRQDGTLRPNAFIPYPYPDLSVTRHLQLAEAALWEVGKRVACQTGKTLYGRADVCSSVFESQGLHVEAAPVPENRNHANVVGWPIEKPAQKSIAQEIAAVAGKIREVPSDSTG